MSTSAPVVLVTQVFPPAIGGSGVLLENVYSRVRPRVSVLTDSVTCPGTDEQRGTLTITRTELHGGR